MSSQTRVKYIDEEIKKIVEQLPPNAGMVVLNEYREMSKVVKTALDRFYEAMAGIEERDSIERIEKALEDLNDACEVNSGYDDIYRAAKREAENAISKVVADEGLNMFND